MGDGIEEQAGGGEIVDETNQRLDAFGREQPVAHRQVAEGDQRENRRNDGKYGEHWPAVRAGGR